LFCIAFTIAGSAISIRVTICLLRSERLVLLDLLGGVLGGLLRDLFEADASIELVLESDKSLGGSGAAGLGRGPRLFSWLSDELS
jgi:uncharacterized membrane protein YeiH